MKKSFLMLCVVCALALSSCKQQLTIVPKAINTVNSVGLKEMNLERKDYTVLNTLTAEAAITYEYRNNVITVAEQNNEFKAVFNYDLMSKAWYFEKFEGIARFGVLSNDYEGQNLFVGDDIKPEYMARNLAIYRLINACKMAGGDGVIEPVISTNVEQIDKRTVLFKTTVSAKVIKIKPDGK